MATENVYCSLGKHKRLNKKTKQLYQPQTFEWCMVQHFNVHNIVDFGSEADEVDYVL